MPLSTIVEIIRAYQPPIIRHHHAPNLQQQKLLELTSLITRLIWLRVIYNSRNYQSLLARKQETQSASLQSTIVEIIRAYQPGSKKRKAPAFNLQQQKLLELTSPSHIFLTHTLIYNSRNYQSLLAIGSASSVLQDLQQQKLLELTSRLSLFGSNKAIYNSRNYQSLLASLQRPLGRSTSTIVEIIRAYQPAGGSPRQSANLQQQKLLELTSQRNLIASVDNIYNSRNYQSLLAELGKVFILVGSTIVEIIRAYQPDNMPIHSFQIYNSRNYQSLLALCVK